MIWSYKEFLIQLESNDLVLKREAEEENVFKFWAKHSSVENRRIIAKNIPTQYLTRMLDDSDELVAIEVAKRLSKKQLARAIKKITWLRAVYEIFKRIEPKAVPARYRQEYNRWLTERIMNE